MGYIGADIPIVMRKKDSHSVVVIPALLRYVVLPPPSIVPPGIELGAVAFAAGGQKYSVSLVGSPALNPGQLLPSPMLSLTLSNLFLSEKPY